jgi:OOP family OmpA-OmpF porin
VHVGILTLEDKQRITAFVLVVEGKAMEGDKIPFLDAGKIGQGIAQAGKVSLYGILFDHDKDVLRPESAATLAEIAKLLNENSELRIEVVGHTDGLGTPDYNMDLSQRRAARVAAALTGDMASTRDD